MPRDTNDHKLYRKNPVFISGSSTAPSSTTYNINDLLKRNATHIAVLNDGTVADEVMILVVSYDGVNYSDPLVIMSGESIEFYDYDIHSVTIDTVTTSSFNYRVVCS